MFYEGHTPLEIVGQLMIATLFLGTLVINAGTKERQHVDRMAAMSRCPGPPCGRVLRCRRPAG
jgi:hypothetical protein